MIALDYFNKRLCVWCRERDIEKYDKAKNKWGKIHPFLNLGKM